MKKIISIVLMVFVLWSCSDFQDENHYYVDPDLKSFVNTFYKEAESRGIIIPKGNLSVVIEDLPNGYIGFYNSKEKKVSISREMFEFRTRKTRFDSLEVEYVVLHEMGHSIGRVHVSDEYYSMMTADPKYMNSYRGQPVSRKNLIDELFKK